MKGLFFIRFFSLLRYAAFGGWTGLMIFQLAGP